MKPADIIQNTAEIVSAFVTNNRVPVADLPTLLATVHSALSGISNPTTAPSPDPAEIKKPSAAEIRRSITPGALVSFEDGKSYKALKRHLGTRGLTPAAYRAKWALPLDYPMVSADFAAKRAAIANKTGLGKQGRKK